MIPHHKIQTLDRMALFGLVPSVSAARRYRLPAATPVEATRREELAHGRAVPAQQRQRQRLRQWQRQWRQQQLQQQRQWQQQLQHEN